MDAARLLYRRGSVLDQERNDRTLLVLTCNCKGNWGAGLAKQFAEKFPDAHEAYRKHCGSHEAVDLIGTYLNAAGIGCLFSSIMYGRTKDPKDEIVEFTQLAVEAMLAELPPGVEVHSGRLNAGHFGVPWEETAATIRAAISVSGHSWIVWQPEGGGAEDSSDEWEQVAQRENEEASKQMEVDSSPVSFTPVDRSRDPPPAELPRLRSQRVSFGRTLSIELDVVEMPDDEDGGANHFHRNLKDLTLEGIPRAKPRSPP